MLSHPRGHYDKHLFFHSPIDIGFLMIIFSTKIKDKKTLGILHRTEANELLCFWWYSYLGCAFSQAGSLCHWSLLPQLCICPRMAM